MKDADIQHEQNMQNTFELKIKTDKRFKTGKGVFLIFFFFSHISAYWWNWLRCRAVIHQMAPEDIAISV